MTRFLLIVLILLGMNTWAGDLPPSALELACNELNQLGNIDELRTRIRRDMRRVRNWVERYDGRSDLSAIEPIMARLKSNNERLNEILGPKYSEADYLQTHDWKLGPKLLWLGEGSRPYWKVKAARVVRVYNWTNRQEEPLDRANLEVRSYKIIAHLQRPASLAELCQFTQTIMVTIEFDVESHRSRMTQRRNLLTQSLREL